MPKYVCNPKTGHIITVDKDRYEQIKNMHYWGPILLNSPQSYSKETLKPCPSPRCYKKRSPRRRKTSTCKFCHSPKQSPSCIPQLSTARLARSAKGEAATFAYNLSQTTGYGKTIGIMIAGNAGRPGGALGGSSVWPINPRQIQDDKVNARHKTAEEDASLALLCHA